MTEDELLARSFERVSFLQGVGLDPTGSVAERLAGVRALIGKLKVYESEIEADARSGYFVLAVPGESVEAVVTDDAVLVLHKNI